MYHLKAVLQPVPRTIVPQTHDVFGIAVKSYNAAQLSHKTCGPKSNAPEMGANVVNNGSRLNRN
jgi:hypothetical protein